MALTPRQKQFYDALVALFGATGRSVHYTAVARALGVSPFSAYDMLKVLEGKGVAASEYVLEGGAAPGPGRSAIRFYPLTEPMEAGPRSGGLEEAEWWRVKQRLLQRLRDMHDSNVRDILSEILSRLSEYASPLSYCAGVIAALLVNLRGTRRELFTHQQLPALRTLVSSGEVGLGTLAGLSIGSSLGRLSPNPLLESLVHSARSFQVQLSALSAESRQKLTDFVREALSTIGAVQR